MSLRLLKFHYKNNANMFFLLQIMSVQTSEKPAAAPESGQSGRPIRTGGGISRKGRSDGSEQGKVITWGSPEHFKNTPRENHRLIRAKDVLRMKGEKHEECEPPVIFGYPG